MVIMRIYRIEHTNGDGPMGTGAAEFFVRYYRDAVREGREPPRRPSGIDPEDIKKRLVEQVTGMVRWTECVGWLVKEGAHV